ncbi:hypothetical protein [Methylomonas sp. MgM2]
MTEQTAPEKDHFVLYLAIGAIALVGVIIAVKLNENEKFEPIKQQLAEEQQQMNIRVVKEYED